MSCRKKNANLADLLLEPASAPAAVRKHVAECADCAAELAALQATAKVLDGWRAPEPGAFFDAKLFARLRAEQEAAPMGLFERYRSQILFGSRLHVRQWAAAGALAAILAIGGGTFALLEYNQPAPVQASATVRDLQSFDGNAQLFQQLNALATTDDNSGDTSDYSN